MNKRIFTLLAGFVLTVSTASAQTIDTSIKLQVGSNEGLYQIVSEHTDKVVYLDSDNKLSLVSPTAASTNYAGTLWCIHVDAYDQGQTPKFDFTNKRFGRILDISMDGAMAAVGHGNLSAQLTVGGDINGWAFSRVYANGVEKAQLLFSYYKADSVVALKEEDNKIVGVKLGANEVKLVAADNSYLFTLKRPDRLTLNAAALNTMLGMNPNGTSFKLNFDKVANSNVFANELMAVSDTLGSFVTLINKSTGNYLRVDTAYNNTTGIKFIKLTDTTKATTYQKEAAAAQAGTAGADTKHYAFKFEYEPSSDSVIITVAGARVAKTDADKYWKPTYISTRRDSLHIYVQDLVTSSVLTVGKDSSDIKLGFGTCTPVATTQTTVPSDLYVIKSEDGKYLAVPLHDQKAQWVTLEKNVDPWTMPSFQWVVEKNNEKSDVSPIKITNREFYSANFTHVQLDKDTAVALSDQKGVSKGVKVDGFLAATAAIKADSLLGYKYLDTMDLKVTRYKFRYLHEFSDDYYVGVNEEVNDSILYVGGKSPFELQVKDRLSNYGYKSDKVAGLKSLYRQTYTLKIRNAKLIFGREAENVGVDAEGRFAISEYFDGEIHNGTMMEPSVFYIKANNEKTIDGKDMLFYAFVNVEWPNKKVGTDDNNLWLKNLLLSESRTSAFSVEVDDSPLYRRFNTTKEGEKATDDPDTVKFFRVNNPADMLFEDGYSVYSKDLNINFLGVNNSVQFPDASRSIYVDTAYVNRSTGYIKPQYMLAVDVDIIPGTPGEPCPLDHNHGFDKDGNPLDANTCSHAIPGTQGYVRGRYLINTVDSAKVNGDYTVGGVVRDADYIWNNQVRLAFVEAIHKADTLYILKGDTAKWADPVDLSKIGSKIRLDNNNHKNVVFSFRLIEEGNDDFLIESAATPATDVIAPMKGGWVKIQNGVPVISYGAFSNAANESEIFNVAKTTDAPTANEGTAASTEVSVQTVAGGVVIRNAAGKSVTISNILGKQVAKSVLTSDNETIDVPAGIVVVVVEGEEVVKAIVK